MKCLGSGVPTGVNVTSMSLNWKDTGASVQTANSISQIFSYSAAPTATVTLIIDKKRFRT
jgi:hypothetical protein